MPAARRHLATSNRRKVGDRGYSFSGRPPAKCGGFPAGLTMTGSHTALPGRESTSALSARSSGRLVEMPGDPPGSRRCGSSIHIWQTHVSGWRSRGRRSPHGATHRARSCRRHGAGNDHIRPCISCRASLLFWRAFVSRQSDPGPGASSRSHAGVRAVSLCRGSGSRLYLSCAPFTHSGSPSGAGS